MTNAAAAPDPAPWVVVIRDQLTTTVHGPFAGHDDAAALAYRIEHGEHATILAGYPTITVTRITPADPDHITRNL